MPYLCNTRKKPGGGLLHIRWWWLKSVCFQRLQGRNQKGRWWSLLLTRRRVSLGGISVSRMQRCLCTISPVRVNWESKPITKSMTQNRMHHKEEIGSWVTASGYAIKQGLNLHKDDKMSHKIIITCFLFLRLVSLSDLPSPLFQSAFCRYEPCDLKWKRCQSLPTRWSLRGEEDRQTRGNHKSISGFRINTCSRCFVEDKFMSWARCVFTTP